MPNGTSAKETIRVLKEIFCTFGLPNELVSDNGPPFSSSEFVSFLATNGIKPIKTPPYHPESNEATEKQVHTVKKSLVKTLQKLNNEIVTESIIEHHLANCLFTYRINSVYCNRDFPSRMCTKNKAQFAI